MAFPLQTHSAEICAEVDRIRRWRSYGRPLAQLRQMRTLARPLLMVNKYGDVGGARWGFERLRRSRMDFLGQA